MKYESYSLREGFILFKSQLEECQSILRRMNSLPEILTLQKNILFLSEMCKRQSLYIVEKVNVNVALNSCTNSLLNIKSEYLDVPDQNIITFEMKNIDKNLDDLIHSVSIKCETVAEQIVEKTNVAETVEKLEDYRAPTELIQAYKDSLKDITAKSGDERLYQEINKRIEKESSLVNRTLEAGLTFMRGSVAINSYIRPYDLKGLDYSVLKIPGISYNHARRETITPIYVFHNQRLAIVNVKRRIVSIGRQRFRNADEVFQEKLAAIERSTDLINQTKKYPTPYLMSPMFKNIRFLWFSEDLDAFKNTKDSSLRLLW